MAKMITIGSTMVNGDQILSAHAGESMSGPYVEILHSKDVKTELSFDTLVEAQEFVKQLSAQLSR